MENSIVLFKIHIKERLDFGYHAIASELHGLEAHNSESTKGFWFFASEPRKFESRCAYLDRVSFEQTDVYDFDIFV